VEGSIIAGYRASRKLVADLQYARHLLIMVWGGKLSGYGRRISQKGVVLWEFRYLKKRLSGRRMRVEAVSVLTGPRLMVDSLDRLRDIVTNLQGTRRRSTKLIDDKVISSFPHNLENK
jgi:hypothetical protein